MRNPISVLKSLEENANIPAYRYERLYRNLYNPEFYLLAYKNIATSQGSMTAGADGMTLDDMSMARINRIIASLKDHSYQPNPARRTYIAKKNSNKKRPLGIPSTDDKLVQKAKHTLAKEHTTETIAAFKKAQKQLLNTPQHPVFETGYKRLQYCRYADDFVVGVVGSKADAERVKADIKTFLADQLKLTLSETKTMVTHSGDLIRFLGYDFTVSRNKHASRSRKGALQRFHYGKVRFYVPHEKWFKKLVEYKALKIYTDDNGSEKWKSIHRGILINRTDVEIVSKYNSEIRGLYNFYRMAVNVSVLNKFYFIMQGSMVRTFACKYKTSFKEIMRRYASDDVFRVQYEGKTGMKTCEFYHDGFTMQKAGTDLVTDTLPQYQKYDKPNSLASRLRGGICEMCGTKTDEIHMYHVKSLKRLTGKNEFEACMLDMRRRSLALCGACYEDLKSTSSK